MLTMVTDPFFVPQKAGLIPAGDPFAPPSVDHYDMSYYYRTSA